MNDLYHSFDQFNGQEIIPIFPYAPEQQANEYPATQNYTNEFTGELWNVDYPLMENMGYGLTTPPQAYEMEFPREHHELEAVSQFVPLADLHHPTPHSRHESATILMPYNPRYPPQFMAGQDTLSPPLWNPQNSTIAPELLSRRPSYQHSSTSTQPSPVIASTSLAHHSPSPSGSQHYRTHSTVSRSDDSGSSSYSPYGHRRDLSIATTSGSAFSPNTPSTQAGSLSATSQRGSSPAHSASSVGGVFGKFSIDPFSGRATSSKKRKRASVSSALVGEPLLSFDSSEDEYVVEPDVDASDEDYDGDFGTKKGKNNVKKGKGRKVKKQRVGSGDSNSTVHGEADHHQCATGWNHSDMASSRGSHGAEIKVHKLIPIERDTESCPHCGFIPGNRRYSDLKRHWEAHLVKEAKEKTRWVCLECGDVRKIIIDEQEEGGAIIQKTILEYVPNVPVLKNYTRKDSARRHWKLDHGEKGSAWDESLVCKVDRIYNEITEEGHVSSEA